MNRNIKNAGYIFGGTIFNSYCMFHAFKANTKWNQYLESLSREDHEEMRARDWFLTKHGRFFGSGVVLGERVELDMYRLKSDKEKESILIQYRWDQLRKSQPKQCSIK